MKYANSGAIIIAEIPANEEYLNIKVNNQPNPNNRTNNWRYKNNSSNSCGDAFTTTNFNQMGKLCPIIANIPAYTAITSDQ